MSDKKRTRSKWAPENRIGKFVEDEYLAAAQEALGISDIRDLPSGLPSSLPGGAPQFRPPPLLEVRPRWLIRRDYPDILGIEQACFGEHAWTEDDFTRILHNHNCIGKVAETTGERQTVGYVVYEMHRGGLRLLNLAVAPQAQRRSVGRQMIERLQLVCSPHRRKVICLKVKEPNLAAQLFFQALGFRAVCVLPGWFDDGQTAYRFVWECKKSSE